MIIYNIYSIFQKIYNISPYNYLPKLFLQKNTLYCDKSLNTCLAPPYKNHSKNGLIHLHKPIDIQNANIMFIMWLKV